MGVSAKSLSAQLKMIGYKAEALAKAGQGAAKVTAAFNKAAEAVKPMHDALLEFQSPPSPAFADFSKIEAHVLAGLTNDPKNAKAALFGALYGGPGSPITDDMAMKIAFPHAKLCAILDIADPFITTEVAKAGIVLGYSTTWQRLQWTYKGATVGAVPCGLENFNRLVKGTAKAQLKDTLRKQVLAALSDASALQDAGLAPKFQGAGYLAAKEEVTFTDVPEGEAALSSALAVMAGKKKPGILGQLPAGVAALAHAPAKPPIVVQAKAAEGPLEIVPFNAPSCNALEMMELPTVSLREATKLYQPVKGSGVGSRYHVVALGNGIAVAARYTDATLSIRIEGKEYVKSVPAIQAFGFSHVSPGHTMGAYASMHLQCPTEDVAAKALGAVIIGLGIAWLSPMPSLKAIAGKGKG